MNFIERLLDRLRQVWAAMTLNQKVITGGSLAAILFASIYISTLGDRMVNYTVLFARLDAQSASEIITRLEQDDVPYRLVSGGTTIEVPANRADRLKIDFTAEGLPQSGIVGYEILDQTNFGMSDFVQKIQYRRALEGELSRTLRMLDGVEDASVRLVIPEPTLFTEQAEPPTASVVLQLRSGRALSTDQISAIQNLIASAAVEGLDPADVTILDRGGNQLNKPRGDDIAMQSSTLMEYKFSYERVLENKVRSMLSAFGRDIAVVNVSADFDFDSLERMSTIYDADNQSILSEERLESTMTSDGSTEENTVTNYNTGSVVENLVRNPGTTMKRLSVSVMIDARDSITVSEDGVQEITPVRWTEDQLTSIRNLTEAAVGFDPVRGDRVEVVSMDFGVNDYEIASDGRSINATVVEGIRAVTLGVAILALVAVFFVVVRAITRSLDPSRITFAAEKEFKRHRDTIEEVQETESERAQLLRRITTKAIQDPELTAKTIKAIYRDES